MKAKKLFALLLAALMVSSAALVSCSDKPADDKQNADTTAAITDAGVTETTEAETTVAPELLDELPTDNKDYEGTDFIVMSREQPASAIAWMIADIYTEEENGERINDAVYARNLAMSERFGVNVKADMVDTKTINNVAQQRISAGEDSFTVLQVPYQNQASLVVNGYLLNMANVEYLNFDKLWWDTTSIDSTSIAGRIYYAAGASQLNNYKATWAVLFNKKLTADANVPDLYELVKSGEWTLDALMTHAEAISNDVNGDGQMKWGEDVFGVGLQNEVVLPLVLGTGANIVKFQNDGTYEFTLGSEKFINAMEQAWKFLGGDHAYVLNANDYDGMTNQWIEFRNLFMADQIGFYMGHLGTVTLVGGDMNSDFGILPFPKVLEGQDEYYSTLQYNNADTLSIPKSTQDIKRTGLLTEAYQMLSYGTVREAYYDYTLTLRSSRDTQSGEMLDMIFAQRNLDTALVFNSSTSMQTTLQSAGTAASFNFASMVASKGKAFQTNIDKVIDKVVDLDV